MISASIVTYHTDHEELNTCLNCIKECREISAVEIVDNSRDNSIELFIRENFPDIIYTPNENVGYGAANNLSLRNFLNNKYGVSSKYHLVLNSDVKFSPKVINVLINKMEMDESIGLIMPSVIGADSKPQSCCHPLPSPLDLILHRFSPKCLFKTWRKRYDIIPNHLTNDINVPYMHGCFMLFRLDALRKIGLFDERFFMYPEDIDITRRMHEYYKTIVTPSVSIYHMHRAASRHNLRMLYIHAINMLRYFNKWGFFVDKGRRKFNRELFDELRTNK